MTNLVLTSINKFSLVEGVSAINQNIKLIISKGKKLDELIQLTAMSIINHRDIHGDTTLADKLFNNMPKGSRRNALADWFCEFGAMSVLSTDDKKKIKDKSRVFRTDRSKSVNLQAGNDKPWYECKPEKPVEEEFNVYAQIQSLLKRVESAKKSGKTIVGGELLAGMTERIAQGEKAISEVALIKEPVSKKAIESETEPTPTPDTLEEVVESFVNIVGVAPEPVIEPEIQPMGNDELLDSLINKIVSFGNQELENNMDEVLLAHEQGYMSDNDAINRLQALISLFEVTPDTLMN